LYQSPLLEEAKTIRGAEPGMNQRNDFHRERGSFPVPDPLLASRVIFLFLRFILFSARVSFSHQKIKKKSSSQKKSTGRLG
jgi:hypothetical protein